jgi:FlaA1/EpsC-like NDP-sugar epimerase
VVINAAAHKHVLSGQRNVAETVRNNLLTTLNLLKARHKNRDSKFVHISTDKAVEPTSVMGASKMLCECMIRSEFPRTTNNSIVRFGNVMNTQGSVLQIWKRQLDSGLPFTITDPNMKRYMISMGDACSQIMRVVGMEPGTYILDMGKEVMVSELLAKFRKANDANSHPIKITGAKPGEKDSEILFWKAEHVTHLKAGDKVVHRVCESPWFNYRQALEVSRDFDDAKTMTCLRGLFGKGMQ